MTDKAGRGMAIQNLSFGFGGKLLFDNFSLNVGEDDSPALILGASGCGKTTLLRLMAGLLKPQGGTVGIRGDVSFVFQEPRLLPWYTALENVALPLERVMGKEEGRDRAAHFLGLVSLADKRNAYPHELSGGQAQRVSIARAFAYPGAIILMDEPFQSLDIPLRIRLMDTVRSLLEEERRLTLAVTHDPREAVYLGRRVLVLGQDDPRSIVFDEPVDLPPGDRAYGAASRGSLEERLLSFLEPR